MTLGKMLTGLTLVVSAGCAPRPVIYARQDYGVGWDKEVALYNIQQILKDRSGDRCASMKKHDYSATDTGIYETITNCTITDERTQFARIVANGVPVTSEFIKWSCIKQTNLSDPYGHGKHCLDFEVDGTQCQTEDNRLCFRDEQQATGAKQAIDFLAGTYP